MSNIFLQEDAEASVAVGAKPVFNAIDELCADNTILRDQIFAAVVATEAIYSKAYGGGSSGNEIQEGITLSSLRSLLMPDGRTVMGLVLTAKYAPLNAVDVTDPTTDLHGWVLEVSPEGKIVAFSEISHRRAHTGAAGLQ